MEKSLPILLSNSMWFSSFCSFFNTSFNYWVLGLPPSSITTLTVMLAALNFVLGASIRRLWALRTQRKSIERDVCAPASAAARVPLQRKAGTKQSCKNVDDTADGRIMSLKCNKHKNMLNKNSAVRYSKLNSPVVHLVSPTKPLSGLSHHLLYLSPHPPRVYPQSSTAGRGSPRTLGVTCSPLTS